MYNADFQRGVLKLLATNLKFALHHGHILKPEYFETATRGILLQLISDYVFQYNKELEVSDMITVIQDHVVTKGWTNERYKELRGEVKAIYTTHINSEQFFTDKLVKYCQRQEMKSALYQSVEILQNDGSLENVLKLVDKALGVGAGHDQGRDYSDLINLMGLYYKTYSQENLVCSGFNRFDYALMGGMAPGEVHVVQAPPKAGKTSFGCCLGAQALMYGKVIYHITLEIKDVDVLLKYALRLTGMSYWDFKQTGEADFKEKIMRFQKYNPRLFVKYYTEGTANAFNIRSWIARVRSKTGLDPDLIIVDYDDCLLPVQGSKDDLYGDAGEIYKDLIAVADYFHCPLLTFAQPNRAAWGKPNNGELIVKGDLAHSARKAHRAYSINSLNFADGAENGMLYMSDVRRGDSHVKIKMRRDLSRSLFQEME